MSGESGAAASIIPAAAAPVVPDAAAAAPVVPVAPPTPAPSADWTSGFNEDLKGYVQNKGFKDVQSLADSYRNFEKLQGVPQDRILKLPESMDSPEARAIWERLGAPKEAKDYKLDMPKEGGDEQLAGWAAESFHKLGVPKAMAENFVKAWNERNAAVTAQKQEAALNTVKQADASLRKEWGAAYDQNKNIVDAAARAMGLSDGETRALGMALGAEKAMRFLHKMGLATGEHAFVTGSPGGTGLMTPEQGRNRVKELTNDKEFVARLSQGDAEAKRQWQTAHEMSYPGEISI